MSAAVRDSLAALVAERRYGDVARLCDKAELEARLQVRGTRHALDFSFTSC